VKARKFVFILFILAFTLKLLDVATTYYGVQYQGLVETNPLAALLMEEYGALPGILIFTRQSLLTLFGVAFLSIPRIGTTVAALVLGGFAGYLVPTVLSNVSLIFFSHGLSAAEIVEIQWWFFVLGVIFTYFAMKRQGLIPLTSSESD